jgi:hypothetical protein
MLCSCTIEVPSKPNSNGKTCEILVVCDKSEFATATGDTLRAFFMQHRTTLNQMEPLFSLANVPMSAFDKSDMFKHMRNTILIVFNPEKPAQFLVKQDAWASNQIVFQFTAPNKQEFFKLFQEKRELMLKAFYDKERTRIINTFKVSENVEISDRLQKTFGFKLVFPEGFIIRTANPDFMSINKETKDYGQNVMVCTYPYTANSFKQENILKMRNQIAQQYIFGPAEGSYMTTEMALPPISAELNLNGRYAIETRGLWKLEGDFMGGPFVNYVFLDEEKNQIVMIDAFLYSPKKPKRDLLMQLESIAYSIKELKIENGKALSEVK